MEERFLSTAMATFDNQQGWLPEENSRDCTQGFCTIYCPQWCYVLFPPPSPFPVTRNFSTSTTAFSPLVIATIGILATFFLVVSYYTLITKFCSSISFHRNHSHHPQNLNGNLELEDSSGENYHQVSWHLPPSNGLDEALIRKITVYRYKRGEGLVDGTECSVCLAEFNDGESLRLLPKCSHAFHLQCIDTWLKSHSNCPLCRANLLLPCPTFEEDSWNRGASAADNELEAAVVLQVLDFERIGDEGNEVENEGNMSMDSEKIEIGSEGSGLLRRSLSLKMVTKDRRVVFAWSSRRRRGGRTKSRSYRSKGLHSVLTAVRMKRSVSSAPTWFARHGKEGFCFF